MTDILKALFAQPYWVLCLLLGGVLTTLPTVSVDKDHHWITHPPNTFIPIYTGGFLLLVSLAGFGQSLYSQDKTKDDGLDESVVDETNGVFSTRVADCEIRVLDGRIEEYVRGIGVAMVLPCNEYFDDRCTKDTRSALGAYVTRHFGDQADKFASLIRSEARRKFVQGTIYKKTDDEEAESFGSGKCLLLPQPLGRPEPVALISTTTQRAGEGLNAQISCLFEGMHELTKSMANARITEVVMPVLAGGHGGVNPALAMSGLILAIAEAARYGQGSQRLKRVTIVNFMKEAKGAPEVDIRTVRRALALVSG